MEEKKTFIEWLFEFLDEHKELEFRIEKCSYLVRGILFKLVLYTDGYLPTYTTYVFSDFFDTASLTYDERMIMIVKEMYERIANDGSES